MGFWIYYDRKRKEHIVRDRECSGKPPLESCLSLTLGLEPMEYNTFYHTVERMLKVIGIGANEFVTIRYLPVREDNISIIQACSPKPDGDMWIEIIKVYDDGIPFHTFIKHGVSFDETIDVFGKVLVDFECPDFALHSIVLLGSRNPCQYPFL